MNSLDENALVNILTNPKNALTKQYVRLFGLDNVELEFESEAICAVAKKAIELKTGARGLRAILEDVMLNVMYEIPTDKDLKKVRITADVINKVCEPIKIYA